MTAVKIEESFLSHPPDSGPLRWIARRAVAVLALLIALASLLVARPAVPAARADVASANQFVAVSPAVLVDTRYGTGGVGVAKVAGKGQITFQVAGTAGIPSSGVAAVALNLTAVGIEKPGWFTVFPSDSPASVATLTYYPGEPATGEDFTRLTGTGKVTVVNNSESPVHIVVGVRGYFLNAADTNAGNEYYPVDTEYLYDTRPGHVTGSPAHEATPVPANSSVTIDVAGQRSIPASGVNAVALNVVAWSQGGRGWLSLHAADQPTNTVPTVDYVPDETDSSFTVAQLTGSGKLILQNHGAGTVHVALTLRGYFKGATEQGGAGYIAIPSKVIVETLTGAGVPGGGTSPLAPGASVTVDVTEGIDLGSKTMAAAALVIQARQPTDAGWLTVYPASDEDPNISSVNYDKSESTTGFDLAAPDYEGKVTIKNRGPGTVHIQASMRGYFRDDETYTETVFSSETDPAEDPSAPVQSIPPKDDQADLSTTPIAAIENQPQEVLAEGDKWAPGDDAENPITDEAQAEAAAAAVAAPNFQYHRVTYDQCSANKAANKPNGWYPNRLVYCKWSYAGARRYNRFGLLLDAISFRVTRVAYLYQGKRDFDYYLRIDKITTKGKYYNGRRIDTPAGGTLVNAKVTTIQEGARSSTIAGWRANPYTKWITRVGGGVGLEKKADYFYAADIILSGVNKELGHYVINVRCDSAPYITWYRSGCVLPRVTPSLRYDLADRTRIQTATHIKNALENTPPILPAYAGVKSILGGGYGKEITRHVGQLKIDANRNKARGVCGSYDGSEYNCDEFPFASTREGAAHWPDNYPNWSARVIDAEDNQKAGRLLGRFYQRDRVLASDRFFVRVY
ncbi:hypothetical protein GCM10010411_75150 [Actinomadura fulvescens]|uniref:Deoxyribonuclease NucA/NucB domain-containing protein n=1 Tax=Actinomadura fulvescens TaxID=46160 RepID=A0ABN3QI22_9ACTN